MPIDPNASIRALLGGGQNIANSRVALRNTQLQDPRTSDAFRRLVMGENAAEEANQAEDPMSQKYGAIAEGQAAAGVANTPEIKALHDQQVAEKLALATAPARTAGEFNVKAAEAAGRARGEAALGAQQAQAERAQQSQAATTARQAATQQSMNDRSRVTGLQSGKIHATRPANEGLLSRFFTGPSQSSLDQAEIARLQGAGGAAEATGGESDYSPGSYVGEQRTLDGIPAHWDGQGWLPVGQ